MKDRLDRCARDWGVTVVSALETQGSILAFGTRGDRAVVLKVVRAPGDEWRAGEILAASSIRDERSVAMTRPAGPTRLAADSAGSPMPVAMSNTRWPGSTPARSSMRLLTPCAPFSMVRHHFFQPAATLSHCWRCPFLSCAGSLD